MFKNTETNFQCLKTFFHLVKLVAIGLGLTYYTILARKILPETKTLATFSRASVKLEHIEIRCYKYLSHVS